MKFILKTLIFLIPTVIAIVLYFLNIEPVSVNFIFFTSNSSPGILIATSFLIGFLISMGVYSPQVFKEKHKVKTLQKQNDLLKEKIENSAILFDSEDFGSGPI